MPTITKQQEISMQKFFKFEIDQSIRIEELNKDTILGLANSENSYVILILQKSEYKFYDIIIDIEYPGYELKITNIIKNYFPKVNIYFSNIGKKSNAHYAAYGTYIGKRKANIFINFSDLLKIIKNDPRTVTHSKKSKDSQST